LDADDVADGDVVLGEHIGHGVLLGESERTT
jgi:hypothetical protein